VARIGEPGTTLECPMYMKILDKWILFIFYNI
jgi:hypothetical protein